MVVVTGLEPVTTTLLFEPKEQVGLSFAPEGEVASAHCRFTCPVNPPAGVTVMVELPDAPRLAMLTAVPDRAKPGGTTGATTVTAIVVVAAVAPPAVAVTVKV